MCKNKTVLSAHMFKYAHLHSNLILLLFTKYPQCSRSYTHRALRKSHSG